MKRTPFALVLLLTLWMASTGWCQTDPQGRALAGQLYQAYVAGANGSGYTQFESLFMSDPQLTRRAFVSTMEYATEIYQQDMQGAQQAVSFANSLAGMIASQLGDTTPSILMQKLTSQDPTATSEFARYATALYPAYATGASGPAGQSGPGSGYSQNPGAYGPGANPGFGPGAYGPGGSPTYNPGSYGPSSNPGAYADVDSDEDGAYAPDSSNGPGSSPYGPSASPYGPSASPYEPSASPYEPRTSSSPFGPSGPNSNTPFRPTNVTGGPAKDQQ